MNEARQPGVLAFRLCFRSLFDSGRGFAFPCDKAGRVALDELSERARNNYLYARAMVGKELAVPEVEPGDLA
ncbi:MAG: hypothetical protein JWP22_4303 [Ramlibacter sp.]|nr:hypothetical protein [Ramlibacter sp.]MDB5915628.1 hypothetical protein [Ramlibacter sp.]